VKKKEERNIMKNLIRRFIRDEEGQDMVEYALLIVFIGLLVIAGMQVLSTGINNEFKAIATTLTS
jgi:pilus assembly protein Flp/PilA